MPLLAAQLLLSMHGQLDVADAGVAPAPGEDCARGCVGGADVKVGPRGVDRRGRSGTAEFREVMLAVGVFVSLSR